jgi:membrane associated rhomboid family serine protease
VSGSCSTRLRPCGPGGHLFDHVPALVPLPGTVVTSMFLHGGLAHLLGNMWFLWIFGDNVEDAMGPVRFAVFYLLCGLLATATHVAADPHSQIPMVGASGAIAGVLGAYLVLYPRHRIVSLVFLFVFVSMVHLPAWLWLGFWFVMQFFTESGQVAWLAHVGGFLAGLALLHLFLIGRPLRRSRLGVAPRSDF